MTSILPGFLLDHFAKKHFGVIYRVASLATILGDVTGPIYTGCIFDITVEAVLSLLQ